jgi:stage V sporulation protein G
MKITEVRVSLRDDAKLKAFASITLDDCFVIGGLKIIEGKDGTFVAMPSRRRKDGEYQDIAHPINNDAREAMEQVILAEYRKEKERAKVAETPHMSDR